MDHREGLRRRALLVLAAATLAAGLPACGGSGAGSVTGPSAPPARPREVINGSWRVDSLGGSGEVYYVVIDVNQTADFDATVQWTQYRAAPDHGPALTVTKAGFQTYAQELSGSP